MEAIGIAGASMDWPIYLALALFVALPALVLAAACVAARLARPEGEAGAEAWGAQDIDGRFKGSRQ